MCAGAAVAATNNVCGVGVAHRANISGLRILGSASHDAMEADALTYMYHDNHVSTFISLSPLLSLVPLRI
jgi:kexin